MIPSRSITQNIKQTVCLITFYYFTCHLLWILHCDIEVTDDLLPQEKRVYLVFVRCHFTFTTTMLFYMSNRVTAIKIF